MSKTRHLANLLNASGDVILDNLDTIDVSGKLDTTGGDLTGNLNFAEDVKATFGDKVGGDLQIYHDGSNSIINDGGAGSLLIQSSTGLSLQDASGNTFIKATDEGTGGKVELYKGTTVRLATTTTGIDVTGTVNADWLSTDGLRVTGTGMSISDNYARYSVSSSTGTEYFYLGKLRNNSGNDGYANIVVYNAVDYGQPSHSRLEVQINQRSGTLTGNAVMYGTRETNNNIDILCTSPDSNANIYVYLKSEDYMQAVIEVTYRSGGDWQYSEDGGESLNGTTVFDSSDNIDFIIQKDGNVGIGTSNPGSKVDVDGGLIVRKNLSVGTTNTGTTGTEWGSSGTDNAVFFDIHSSIAAGHADYSSRIIRNSGENANFELRNRGTGAFMLKAIDAGHIRFDTSNTEAMRITSSGKVGIGTSNPNTLLDVSSGALTGTDITISNTRNDTNWTANPNFGALKWYTGDSSGAGAGVNASINLKAVDAFGHRANMTFAVPSTSANNVERMTIEGYTGNVGIGTTSPNTKLNIAPVSYSANRDGGISLSDTSDRNTFHWDIKSNSGGAFRQTFGNSFKNADGTVSKAKDEALTILSSGKVGIGTSNPGYLLDVGSSASSGTIRVTNNVFDSWILQKRRSDDTQLCGIKEGGSGGLGFYTGIPTPSERLTITRGGNVGIGTSNPTGKLEVAGSLGNWSINPNGVTMDFTRPSISYIKASDVNGGLEFQTGGANNRMRITSSGKVGIGTNNPSKKLDISSTTYDSHFQITRGSDVGRLTMSGAQMLCNTPSGFSPSSDNSADLGRSDKRWDDIYATNSTIITSDAREKTEIRSLTADEIEASKQLVKEIGAFKFLSAVELKGDEAREHIGMTVQRAIEIMEANNLDPFNYGFIGFNEWEGETQDYEAELDDDGNVVKEAYTFTITEAGSRYSFRPDELMKFTAVGFNARIEALEAQLGE